MATVSNALSGKYHTRSGHPLLGHRKADDDPGGDPSKCIAILANTPVRLALVPRFAGWTRRCTWGFPEVFRWGC